MIYTANLDSFNSIFAVKENGTKLTHNSGKRFKLFPFVANNNVKSITELTSVVGKYLSYIQKEDPSPVTPDELTLELQKETDIQSGDEELFQQVIRNIFFTKDGCLIPSNIKMLTHMPCDESNKDKLANYLVDVLADSSLLEGYIKDASQKLERQSNVLEQLAMSKLKFKSLKSNNRLTYFQVSTALKECFEHDFEYIIRSRGRTQDYLVPLLEFYYFSYTAQSIMQLNRFLDGSRTECVPLYFSLEWEKTSQSRLCYKEGWNKLERAINCIFAHAIVLEILNQTSDGSPQIDYICLNELINSSPGEDNRISQEIHTLCTAYRTAITDCPEMGNIKLSEGLYSSQTASEVKFLFDSVVCQFENTSRSRPYTSYAKQFTDYCQKYLKHRGRSGSMLNLTEETLILLTKIIIKSQEKMRLNDVFTGFQTRGVFLDTASKEQIMQYYEKLNLIEKKSDSGDAQYVKRIL